MQCVEVNPNQLRVTESSTRNKKPPHVVFTATVRHGPSRSLYTSRRTTCPRLLSAQDDEERGAAGAIDAQRQGQGSDGLLRTEEGVHVLAQRGGRRMSAASLRGAVWGKEELEDKSY